MFHSKALRSFVQWLEMARKFLFQNDLENIGRPDLNFLSRVKTVTFHGDF